LASTLRLRLAIAMAVFCAIPCYAFRSRGRSGWKLLPVLILLMFPTYLTALALYLLGLP